MPRRPAGYLAGGRGVRSDLESEGFEEKYRAVIDWGEPRMNRSAKDGARSSPHYGGEGVTHSPIVPRCLLTARYGRFMCAALAHRARLSGTQAGGWARALRRPGMARLPSPRHV